jgi:hypothetical protein
VLNAACLLLDAVVAALRWTDRIDVPTEDELIGILDTSPSTSQRQSGR